MHDFPHIVRPRPYQHFFAVIVYALLFDRLGVIGLNRRIVLHSVVNRIYKGKVLGPNTDPYDLSTHIDNSSIGASYIVWILKLVMPLGQFSCSWSDGADRLGRMQA